MLVVELGKVLRARRKSLSITQPTLSDLSGVNLNTIVHLERGQGNPTFETLEKVASVLGLELRLEIKSGTSNK